MPTPNERAASASNARSASSIVTRRAKCGSGITRFDFNFAIGAGVTDDSTSLGLTGSAGLAITEVKPTRSFALLGTIDFTHPLFSAFAEPRFSDFTKIRFWNYCRVDPAALKDATVKQRFADLGAEAYPLDRATPEALHKFLKSEIDKWGPIIKKAGQYAD